jgi:hypothetical protein
LRFACDDGCVELSDFLHGKRRAKTNDPRFWTERAWDQRAETGYMKAKEDAFQALAETILEDNSLNLSSGENEIVSAFFALWHCRALQRDLPYQFVKPQGIARGPELTKDQLEILEKNGYMTSRQDGSIAFRHLNGVSIQLGIDRMLDGPLKDGRWAVIIPERGKFCVPDFPQMSILPLSPDVALALNQPRGTITEANLAFINHSMNLMARDYVFARSFEECPGIGPIGNAVIPSLDR